MPRRLPWISRWKVSIALVLLTAAAASAFLVKSFYHAHVVLNQSETQVAQSGELGVSLEQIPDALKSAFDYSLSPAGFHSVVTFDGDTFLAAQSSLARIGSNGDTKRVWRSGAELPSSPLSVVAVRKGIGTPELWIGTAGSGVVIYNGQLWKHFLPADLALRNITALLPLSDGRVLLGTGSAGLYVTDGKRLRLFHPQFARSEVTALAGDENELWVGTRRGGLWRWRGGEAFHFQDELPDHQVLSLFASPDGTWAGTPLGVAEFQSGEYRRPVAQGVFAQSLLEKEGTLWIGTIDEGILSVPLQTPASRLAAQPETTESEAADQRNIVALTLASDGILAVSPSNVVRVPSGETLLPPQAPHLADGHVTALHLDSQGRLWVGYFDHGIDIVHHGASRQIEHVESDVLFCVNRIKEDAETGTVAVGTANGLALFDSSARLRQRLDRKTGLAADHVTDLLYEKDVKHGSSLLVATPAGVSFVEPAGVSSISAFQGLVNNHVYTLADWNGTLFAGTLGGLSLLRSGLVQASYTTANSSLRQNWITASVAVQQDLFVGTYGSGVIRVDPQMNITNFREFSGARVEINPNALLATDCCIYAGTAGHGLGSLRRGEERWQWIETGLPSQNVTALAARNGTLYIGTDNGLVSVAEHQLNP